DGFLIHMGRKDFQVKIRGFRVEIAEIENALVQHPQVKDAGVVAGEREDGEKYLTAYVVPREYPRPVVEELRNYLKDKLPDYMIRSFFMFLESLPLTNGKLDRKVLPKPYGNRPQGQHYVAPRTPVEEMVAGIWAELLDVEQVGVHDNFLDLGGYS